MPTLCTFYGTIMQMFRQNQPSPQAGVFAPLQDRSLS
jgi:hypothetical protein